MALTWVRAASGNAAPSMAVPMTNFLSTTFKTSCGDCPGMGFEKVEEVHIASPYYNNVIR